MGSLVYAKECRDRGEYIVAMLWLETIGYYCDEPGSQKCPFPLNLAYPLTGNFIGFISNLSSGNLLRQAIASFRSHSQFPSEGAIVPHLLPGIGWSDGRSFWQQDYPAIMITDTAPFRYAYYHTIEDTPDKINDDRLARVVAGIERVVADLVKVKN
ncbi:M28 family peptidase [Oxynema sp. CENA135]|uniref:M28 family peptidase n=1 Tax=Oxynema sp. CENA135 TaxID=984206 RepID=UPI00190D79C4|nr:M28 family peptidase [Oxynema sp. CENA135]